MVGNDDYTAHGALAFADILIVGLNEERCNKASPDLELYSMYLKLSDSPPVEWRKLFSERRNFPRHSMWRDARISGDHIIISCVPEELERYHLRDLKEDVDYCNGQYRKYLDTVSKKEVRELKERQAELERLKELNRRLKFD